LPYREDDAIVMDELVHNSLVMGVRMGRLRRERVYMFRHNDVVDLRRVLNHVASSSSSLSSTLVVVESVYSMDGDIAPLKSILELAKDMGAGVMVDEAHGLGVYGHTNTKNLEMISTDGDDGDIENDVGDLQTQGGAGVLAALNLERHPALLCSIHTFGKAAGCHGAIVAGSSTLIAYLVNYARPFVYSTALPPHSLVSIQQAYKSMMGVEGERRRTKVFRLVRYFREGISANLNADFPGSDFELLPSPSPIQALVVPGNEQCISVCLYLRNVGFDVYAIRSPTVTKGKERIRIILHAHNNEDEVSALMKMLVVALKQLSFPDRLNVISKL
jgi:8-amino-7-oxononanoate synthase